MDDDEAGSAPTAGLGAMDHRVLPENSVEYYLFCIDRHIEARKRLSQLESVRQHALELCRSLAKDYIWQRQEFNLELRNEQGWLRFFAIDAPRLTQLRTDLPGWNNGIRRRRGRRMAHRPYSP
jgi:hypothetical protein